MEPLLSMLITAIILALVVYLLFYVLGKLAIPEPVRTIILVITALIILVYFVQRFGLL